MSIQVKRTSSIAFSVFLLLTTGFFLFLQNKQKTQAHIEAEFTYVYPSESGRLHFLSIDRGAWVDPTDLLFSLTTKQTNKLINKNIYAGKSAQVFDVYHKVGEWLNPSQPVLSLLSPEDVKLVFVYPENKLQQIHLNQTIKVKAAACKPWCTAIIKKVEGSLEEKLQKKPTKLVLRRIEARFTLQEAKKLHPGEHVDIIL